MRRSLIALLRGSDGRSLARALACLLLVNAVVAGLADGAMAAPGPAGTICTVAGAVDGGPDLPGSRGSDGICCAMGCVPSAPLLPPEPATGPGRTLAPERAAAAPGVSDTALPAPSSAAHRPRGPPVLA